MPFDKPNGGRKVTKLLNGLRILLIEDDAFIALDCQEGLLDAGAGTVELAKSKKAVLDLLATGTFDVAVVDIQLGSESGIPIAEILAGKDIPVVFCTGSPDQALLPAPLKQFRIVAKPYNMAELIEAIGSMRTG